MSVNLPFHVFFLAGSSTIAVISILLNTLVVTEWKNKSNDAHILMFKQTYTIKLSKPELEKITSNIEPKCFNISGSTSP